MTDTERIERLEHLVRILAAEVLVCGSPGRSERGTLRAFVRDERPADSDEVRRLRIELVAANQRAEEARAEVAKAEERGARWALVAGMLECDKREPMALRLAESDAARICAEARAKGGE